MCALAKRREDARQSPGELISQARKRVGLTESEMAKKLGTNVITCRAYEKNIAEPSSSVLYRIAQLLNIDLKEIQDAYTRYWQAQN